jgi:glucose uptake protein
MYQPATYAVTLAFMITSMLCWGSWANTVKLCPGYRFQLFYWDYVIGLLVGVLFWGLTLGSAGQTGQSFLAALSQTSATSIEYAIIGGVIFNVANLLLVAAIDIAGLAVAFPVGIGVALVVGAVSSYLIAPAGNKLLLFGGIAFVVAAILFDAAAYRLRDTDKQAMSKRGVIISVISGLLMGSFYPFVAKAMDAVNGQGPYATAFFFVLGVAACAVPINYLFMRKPLDGREPVGMQGYWSANRSWHLWGIFGGAIWCTGAVLNFVASRSQTVGPAISYSIGQGATMISACWGVFVWREFSHAPKRAKTFLTVMFVLFLIGLTAVALAPIL